IDGIYATFRERVAAGRNLTPDQVREVARGRVWTGEQARARGLVDHIGGFQVAIARARALAEIGENERTELRYFPAQRSPFEELQQLFGTSAESARAAAVLGAMMGDERLSAVIRAARDEHAGARAQAAPLTVR
ncbi:MAG: signal peptide peptidase SppA, partial [Alphaproteobacteria bacterium]|nr:signal peptide peptidase SppA [Alphaproteobacteria bacterium]